MRMLCFLFLLLLAVAIGIFAVQNPESITLQYLGRTIECPPALLVAVIYLLGMVSGGAVLGLVQRSWRRVTGPPPA